MNSAKMTLNVHNHLNIYKKSYHAQKQAGLFKHLMKWLEINFELLTIGYVN